MSGEATTPRIAIACGGTGGHLFPGLAVAGQLQQRGCAVTLLISPKEVDQQAVRNAAGLTIETLPAVGLARGSRLAFAGGFFKSLRASRRLFAAQRPDAVLAMGGFTSAPPVIVARMRRLPAFLHESNSIPGRANRWLSRWVTQAFIGFPEAAARLRSADIQVTGTPVRAEFRPASAAACRTALGLEPQQPVLLVTGGSQGASGLNKLVIETLPLLAKSLPGLQLFQLTGPNDVEAVRQAAREAGIKAVVHPFFAEMHVALGAASVALSRAGASSLSELAAMRVPAVLVPYPAATDNHQLANARAFENYGAARLLEQASATPGVLAGLLRELIHDTATREKMRAALEGWHTPRAAEKIADYLLLAVSARRGTRAPAEPAPPTDPLHHRQSALT